MADIAKTCFLIVGLPRSGTSTIAQFLDHLGVYFGDPSHFLDTAKLKHNPIFYELQWINDFNDKVMAVWGCTYVDDVMPIETDFERPEIESLRLELRERLLQEFGDRHMIGVKDPRICFTFPLWRDVLADMGYEVKTVLTLRAPSAIIKSNRALTLGRLSRWQRFYARHLLALRYFTRNLQVNQFDFDLLMQDPVKYGQIKAAELGLAIDDPLHATSHLSRQHYHHQPDDAGTGDAWVDRIDSELRNGRLDPKEYLRFRSVAVLFIGDLREQDRDIQQALSQKDSYIRAVEERNKEAAHTLSATARHIAGLEELMRLSVEKVQAFEKAVADRDTEIQQLRDELARLQENLKRSLEEGQLRQARADSLSAKANSLSAKADSLSADLAALTERLNELQARRMVRLMHWIDRKAKRVSKPTVS